MEVMENKSIYDTISNGEHYKDKSVIFHYVIFIKKLHLFPKR